MLLTRLVSLLCIDGLLRCILSFMLSLLCLACVSCEWFQPAAPDSEQDKRLLALLEIRSERVQSREECLVIYALDSSDRYVFRRLPDDPTRPVSFEMDVPQPILDTMSTQRLLKTALGHPLNVEIAPFTVCTSVWRCRESMFLLYNAWRALEQRPDALEECFRRYDKLNVLCDSSLRTLFRLGVFDPRTTDVLRQTSLIESFLTRPAMLSQLSPKVLRRLAAKVLAKHKQKESMYESELGKTEGLWLMAAIMVQAKDPEFLEAVEKNRELKILSQGLFAGHPISTKNALLPHVERFIKTY